MKYEQQNQNKRNKNGFVVALNKKKKKNFITEWSKRQKYILNKLLFVYCYC